MSKYSELQAKLESNHKICENIQAELKTMQPEELWVCFYKNEAYDPVAFPTEKQAMNHHTSLVEKVVRYVLPAPESDKPIEETKTT